MNIMIIILKRETIIFAENYFYNLLKNKTVTSFCTRMTTTIIIERTWRLRKSGINYYNTNEPIFVFFSCIGSGRSSDF